MNTSKRKQKAIRLGIAAVLALVLLVAVSVVLVIANTTPTVQADAMKVTLDGKVNLIFKFNDGKVNAGTVSYTAVIGEGGREIKGLESEKVDGKNVVTVPLMPYEMAETVSLYQVDKDGNNLAVSTGSVRAYADKVLASNDYAAHHNAIRALLNYGAMTQIDANKNTSNLANAEVFVRNNPIDIIKAVPFDKLVDTTGDLTGEISLVFSNNNGISDIALRYDINYEAGHNEELRAVIDGVSEGVRLEEVTPGKYRFEITNIGVNDFETVWNVEITAPNGETSTSHHSVLQYLDYLVKSSDKAEEKDVARSLYQLYQNTKNKLETNCAHKNSGYYIPADVNSSYLMCAACGNKIQETAINNNVTAYFSGAHLAAVDTEFGGTLNGDNGEYSYTFTTGGTLQHIWLREQYIVQTTGNASLGAVSGRWANTSFDIGNAQYVVVRYKWSNRTSSTGIALSLGSAEWTWEDTGYIDGDQNFVSINGGEKNQTGIYSETKFFAGDGSDYMTYVISLDKFGDKVAATDGSRIIDSMKIAINGKTGDVLNIDYIAFVKDLKDIGDATVLLSNNVNGKDVVALNPATGKCAGACVNTNGDTVCDICGKTVASTYILNGSTLNKLDVAERGFLSVTGSGTIKVDRKNQDAALYLVKSKEDIENKDYGAKFDVGNAEYIVVKYKTNSTKDASDDTFRLVVSTTGASSDKPVKTEGSNPSDQVFNGLSSIRIEPTSNEEWVYMVIHAPTALLGCNGNPVYVKDATSGTYILDCFYIETIQPRDTYFEIDYVAFAESTDEIDALLEGDTSVNEITCLTKAYNATKFGLNPGENVKKTETVTNGVIQHAGKVISVIDNNKSVVCTGCGLICETGTPTTGVNAYLNATQVGTGNVWSAGGSATKTTEKFADGISYLKATCIAKQNGYQHVWLREAYKANTNELVNGGTLTGGGGHQWLTPSNTPGVVTRPEHNYTFTYNGDEITVTYPQKYVLGIGKSKYMIVRVKTDFERVSIALSTEEIKDVAGNSGSQCSSAYFYTSNEWTTYVVDLSVYDTAKFKANTNGEYFIDSFEMLAYPTDGAYAGKTLSLDYIAFVDDWKTCSEIIKDDTVQLVKSKDGLTVGEMNKDGSCVIHASATETIEVGAESDTYKYTCTECGSLVSSKVVPHTTNKYLSGTKLESGLVTVPGGNSSFNGGKYSVVYDGVLRLQRSSSAGAVECNWLRERYSLTAGGIGGGDFTFNGQGNIPVGDAKYMILKVKSNAANAQLYIRLGTTGWTYNDYANPDNQNGIFQTIYLTPRTAQNDEWTVYVIDLDKFGDKVRKDGDGTRTIDSFKIQTNETLQLTEYIDVAYIAFTADWAETAALVDEQTVVQIVGNNDADRTVVNKDGTAVVNN